MKTEILKNSTLNHLQKFQYFYFSIITLIIWGITSWLRYRKAHPLLFGNESYYHLVVSQSSVFHPLHYISSSSWLFLIPLILALANLFLILKLGKKLNLSNNLVFFSALFLIISPNFIYGYTTIISATFYLFLVLLGFSLLLSRYSLFTVIPFLAASFIDIFSTILILALLAIYYYTFRSKIAFWIFGAVALCLILNVILGLPFVNGPLYEQNPLSDLLSDLGAVQGLSFFILLLFFIGLATAWKTEKYSKIYFLLPILIVGYILNTNIIFSLSVLIIFFAAIGFTNLFERKWVLGTLKTFSVLLLFLGMIFSTISYLERLSSFDPSSAEVEALTWIRENTAPESIILSSPENGYFIQSFSQRPPLKTSTNNLTTAMFNASYISELFPLLEANNVSIIYITPKMKQSLPTDQGFIFLLKNERFKLLHSWENHEVWLFSK